jgi:hypothetical protein
LNNYNFEDLKRDTILDCISNANERIYFDVTIEDLLKKQDLESFINNAYRHIKEAVNFLYKNLFIIDIRLLPYPSQLIFISEYFRINSNPTDEQIKKLENWFWITTYSNYFTMYSISQQRNAYQTFCEFSRGEHSNGIYKVNDDTPFNTAKYPNRLNFTGVRPKALQLFYLKSIIGNTDIQEKENIKEFFISSKKDRSPANIILRLSSEFEKSDDNKLLNDFIENSSKETLEKHFITSPMVDLYIHKDENEFISAREQYLKLKENEFVNKIGINYKKD